MLEVLSRRSDRFSNRIALPELRSARLERGKDTGPPPILSRKDPVNNELKMLDNCFLDNLSAKNFFSMYWI